jgi:hypothetical protein
MTWNRQPVCVRALDVGIQGNESSACENVKDIKNKRNS